MNVSGIPFLTEISNKSAESITGGFTFKGKSSIGVIIASGTVNPDPSEPNTPGEVLPGTHTVDLRSNVTGGGFRITIPGRQDPLELFPTRDDGYVTLGPEIVVPIAISGARLGIEDIGFSPIPGTCDTSECQNPSASGGSGAGGSSLTFFPSS